MSRRVKGDLFGRQNCETKDRRRKTACRTLLFVAWHPNTIPQELVADISPAKRQTDQVFAGIDCSRASAPVHSSTWLDPSDSFREVWTWPASCGSDVPGLARLRAPRIVHTVLSLSTVPLECKLPVSHQHDILGPRISAAVHAGAAGGGSRRSHLSGYS